MGLRQKARMNMRTWMQLAVATVEILVGLIVSAVPAKGAELWTVTPQGTIAAQATATFA